VYARIQCIEQNVAVLYIDRCLYPRFIVASQTRRFYDACRTKIFLAEMDLFRCKRVFSVLGTGSTATTVQLELQSLLGAIFLTFSTDYHGKIRG
jgi:hypothetical protein